MSARAIAPTIGARRRRRLHVAKRACALLVMLSAALALSSVQVSAKVTRPLLSSFNGSDAPGGPFGVAVIGAAVDQASGSVYVLESDAFGFGRGTVDKFDEDGAYAGVQIVGAETPQGSFAFGFSSGIAVDNSLGVNHGDVYVADTEHGVVDRFSSSGAYECQITGLVTASATECAGPSGSETPDGSVAPAGLAVDSSGDLYVADNGHAVVDKFSPSGGYIGQISDPHLSGEKGSIALDTSGDLYVSSGSFANEHNVVKFDPQGAFVSVFDSNYSEAVAVDPATGNVDISEGQPQPDITEYDPTGALVSVFGQRPNSEGVAGLAVNGGTGRVYAATLAFPGFVDIFGAAVVIPDVTTGAASAVQVTGATLNGRIDPDTAHGGGEVTRCEFEYGTSTAYGQTAPCAPATPYAGATVVSAGLTALSPGTTYHFRLEASNTSGANEGEDGMFTTPGPPVIDSESAVPRTTSAVVAAQIDPSGLATTCEGVEYVEEAEFQRSGYANARTVPCTPSGLGSGFGEQSAGAALGGLRIGTTYHFRFIAANQAGTTTGADRTFATFGIDAFKFEVLDREGHPYTQAGGHPYELATSFAINEGVATGKEVPDANLKDIVTELPPGLIGDVSATPKCTRYALDHQQCSIASQIGRIEGVVAGTGVTAGVYNLVPPAGVPAEFGARASFVVNAYIESNVRTGGDYGVNSSDLNVTAQGDVQQISLKLWGVPADPGHDGERYCGKNAIIVCSSGVPPVPFLTNPVSCAGPQNVTLRADSWQEPGAFVTASATLPAATGCERLDFTPAIAVQPDTSVADSPSGLHVDLRLPQNENAAGLAEADLKQAAVTLPAGMSVSPAAANGLQACSPVQIGLHDSDEPSCPDASKIGTVEIDTPLLSDPLTGDVYVAQQNNNPFDSLLAIYLTAHADGALVKLAGHVVPDPLTGQLTTTFDENPQLPFSELKLDLFGGPRGALATPEDCGTFTTDASLTPWSGTAPVSLASPFAISSGCVSGFAPGFTAGSESPRAGSYSPLALSFSRSDSEQNLAGVSVGLPPGLLGKIAGIPLCPDAAASAGACPAGSQVGTVQAAAGVGPDPLFVSGSAYLTGPYRGGPYGLAVEVPAIAGPFDLGTVVVRQSLRIDPHDAHVTAVSDPLPTILDGIPLRVRRVDVTLDRPGFTLNPTDCKPTAIAAALTSTTGANAQESSRFQVGGCGELPFRPSFKATTRHLTSRANGASLTVDVALPAGDANIAKVDLQLPRQLPSRLKTLQQACTAAQFEANPAGCPQGSDIGSAKAVSPLLSDPLTGPAYLVSHGGEAFPDVEFVLQADGVTIDLDGKTQIKGGVTFSHFETVPDAPITSFETTLPQGPHSILAANIPARAQNSLCGIALSMPTSITAQNGAVVKQATKIAVTGCARGTRSRTAARRLAAALRACRKDKARHARVACERTARRRHARGGKGGRN